MGKQDKHERGGPGFRATLELVRPERGVHTLSRDVHAIKFHTPSGQPILIRPSADGKAIDVLNPQGHLDHTLRPKDPPRDQQEESDGAESAGDAEGPAEPDAGQHPAHRRGKGRAGV